MRVSDYLSGLSYLGGHSCVNANGKHSGFHSHVRMSTTDERDYF